MTDDPLVFGDLPMPIKVVLIGGAIALMPYLVIQAWREGRREKRQCQKN